MLPGVTTLREPLQRSLGPKTANKLEEIFGLRTVGDLLRHYPRRYYTRGELTDLSSLREGNHVTVLARVVTVAEIPLPPLPGKGRRSRLEVVVTDDRAKLILTFFSGLQPVPPGAQAPRGRHVRGHRVQLPRPPPAGSPGVRDAARGAAQRRPEPNFPELAAEFATEMIPVYPASAKFSSWSIARSVKIVLESLDAGEDPLPAELREREGLYGRAEAIRAIHRPLDPADRDQARKRLKWDEAFMLQAALAQRRLAAAAMPAMPRPRIDGRHRRRVRRPAAVHAHQRPGRGGRDHRHRAELRLPDAPAAAGRGRLGQDGDRDPGHAPGGRRRRPGGPARADRSARAAALPVDHRHARAAGPAGPARRGRARDRRRPAHRVGRGRRPARGAVGRLHRRRRDRDRHPRPARGAGPVRRPGPGGHRRAAQVRRGTARRAARQGRGQPAARPGHDGDADPQDGGHDRLRRPGDLHADRAARRPFGHRHPRGARRGQAPVPGAGLGARPGGGQPRPAGLRGMPAHRRWAGF